MGSYSAVFIPVSLFNGGQLLQKWFYLRVDPILKGICYPGKQIVCFPGQQVPFKMGSTPLCDNGRNAWRCTHSSLENNTNTEDSDQTVDTQLEYLQSDQSFPYSHQPSMYPETTFCNILCWYVLFAKVIAMVHQALMGYFYNNFLLSK